MPHRVPGGIASQAAGLSARAMIESRLKAYLLFGSIDPANDFAETEPFQRADLVIAATTHLTESLREGGSRGAAHRLVR